MFKGIPNFFGRVQEDNPPNGELISKYPFKETYKCEEEDGKSYICKVIQVQNKSQFSHYLERCRTNFECPLSLWRNPHIVIDIDRLDSSNKDSKRITMCRQYFHISLADRVNTRPTLSHMEKIWISFQLLKYMTYCEDARIYHGNLTSNNVMLTSWNWVYVVDSGYPHRPVYISKHKQDFMTLFSSSKDDNDRACFLAPERITDKTTYLEDNYYKPRHLKDANVKEREQFEVLRRMDIFSLGCILYVLWTGSRALFDYDDFFDQEKVRRKIHALGSLGDLGDLIKEMVSFESFQRKSSHYYLKSFKNLFPDYLDALHVFIHHIMFKSPDDRVIEIYNLICDHGLHIGDYLKDLFNGEWTEQTFPYTTYEKAELKGDSCTILLNMLCSSVRHLKHISTIIKCFKCIECLSEYVDDRVKLQLVLPYLTTTISNKSYHPSAIVRAQVLKVISKLLSGVKQIPDSDIFIFQVYLVPIYNYIKETENESIVLQALAETLPQLCNAGKFFYDSGCAVIKNMKVASKDILKGDTEMKDNYKKLFKDIMIKLLKNQEIPSVRKTMLSNILLLCSFFGIEETQKTIIYLIVMCLKSDNEELRCAALDSFVEVCGMIQKVEEYVLEYIEPMLYDTSESVVDAVLNSLASLCDLGILKRSTMLDLCEKVSPLLIHPNAWIRFGAMSLILSVENSNHIRYGDKQCFLIPAIQPFMKKVERPKRKLSREIIELQGATYDSDTMPHYVQEGIRVYKEQEDQESMGRELSGVEENDNSNEHEWLSSRKQEFNHSFGLEHLGIEQDNTNKQAEQEELKSIDLDHIDKEYLTYFLMSPISRETYDCVIDWFSKQGHDDTQEDMNFYNDQDVAYKNVKKQDLDFKMALTEFNGVSNESGNNDPDGDYMKLLLLKDYIKILGSKLGKELMDTPM